MKQEVKITCKVCNEKHSIYINLEDHAKYICGMTAQKAFPYLTADERELIISKTCGPCYDKTWKFNLVQFETTNWRAKCAKCNYWTNQKDNNGDIAIEHCTHPQNGDPEHEGNCTKELCPLKEITHLEETVLGGSKIHLSHLHHYVSAYISNDETVKSLAKDLQHALKRAKETTEIQIVDQDGECCFHVTPAGYIKLMLPWRLYKVAD